MKWNDIEKKIATKININTTTARYHRNSNENSKQISRMFVRTYIRAILKNVYFIEPFYWKNQIAHSQSNQIEYPIQSNRYSKWV